MSASATFAIAAITSQGDSALERNLLGMVGIAPVHETLIGLTGNMTPAQASKWLSKPKRLGERAE